MAASGDALERPAGTELLAFEGEIALVIGTTARRVTPEQGWAAVSGVTASNDFGALRPARGRQGLERALEGRRRIHAARPGVIPAAGLDPAALRVRTWVNGELVQEGTTDTLLFPFGQLVADLSQLLTLEPGDVILTGTPAGLLGRRARATSSRSRSTLRRRRAKPTSGRLVTRITEGTVPFSDAGAKPAVDDHAAHRGMGRRGRRGPRRASAGARPHATSCSPS